MPEANVAACLQANMRSSKACKEAIKAICRCPMSCCDVVAVIDKSSLRLPCEDKRRSQLYQEGKMYNLRYIKVPKRNSFAISEALDNQSTHRLLLAAC